MLKFDIDVATGLLRKKALEKYGRRKLFGTWRIHRTCVFMQIGQFLWLYAQWE